jgi:hypothetical protein
MSRWSRITLKTLGVLFALILIAYISIAIYVNTHKRELLVTITKELNKNLDGSLVIESMEPTILRGFPGVSLTLKNVLIKDRLWARHKHTLLKADAFNISVNTLGLLRGTITIKKITISDASIYLFTDSSGYSNASIFRKKNKVDSSKVDDDSSPEIRKFLLKDVNLVFDNQKNNKLFNFSISKLDGNMDYKSSGWSADLDLKAMTRSLAFNTKRGSFIKNQEVDGRLEAEYREENGVIAIKPNELKIGNVPFRVAANFNISKDPVEFTIEISAEQIQWKTASSFLAPNIRKRLDRFDMKLPIPVKCKIVGSMGGGGDPKILVTTTVRENTLTTPGGLMDHCSFKGMYSNNDQPGKGNTDSNSLVRLLDLKGNFEGIPLNVDTALIRNLITPVASGIVKAKFPVAQLNRLLGNDLIKFTDGNADLELRYKANLVDLVLTKPAIGGHIIISKADLVYVPRNLRFKDTDISLKFVGPDLFIDNLRVQSGQSTVLMGGSVKNFMNLYYSSPEKIIFNWNVKSPQLYLGEFLGFLGSRTRAARPKGNNSGQMAERMYEVFDRSQMDINMQVDKVYYKKFLGTDAVAQISISEDGIVIRSLGLKHAGGSINITGNLSQSGKSTAFMLNSAIKNANIKSLFYGFNNFGLQALGYQNLTGNLSSGIHLGGRVSNTGALASNSLKGSVVFALKNGSLLNFQPLINVGKFAFPLRDLNNITFSNLNGSLLFNGEKITIAPMKVSSSILNLDIAGVYSMGKGTNIALDVPLRNPKKDKNIEDAKEKADKRMSGIVLHLQAVDGEDGKIKIKLNRNKDKDKES